MSCTARSAMLLLVLLAALPAQGGAQTRRTPVGKAAPARKAMPARKAAPASVEVRPEGQAAALTHERLEIAQAQLRASDGARVLGMERAIAGRLARAGGPPCRGTQIREVFPRTLYPGDRVVLLGCGLPAKPSVLMSVPAAPGSFTQAQVTGSDASHIEAVVPTLAGFTTPAQVAFRIAAPGQALVSPTVSLAPELEIVGLDVSDPQTSFRMSSPLAHCRGAGHMPMIVGASFEFVHPNPSPTVDCSGTDLFQSTRSLNPGWAFESAQIWTRCLTRTALEDCGAQSQAILPEAVQYLAGETMLPRIAITWKCARTRTCAYGGAILVKGPKGTRPY